MCHVLVGYGTSTCFTSTIGVSLLGNGVRSHKLSMVYTSTNCSTYILNDGQKLTNILENFCMRIKSSINSSKMKVTLVKPQSKDKQCKVHSRATRNRRKLQISRPRGSLQTYTE